MDKQQELEIKIRELERQHEDLEGRFVAALRSDGHQLGYLLVKVRELEERIKYLDQLERIALASYQKTHPEALAKVEEINESIEDSRHQQFMRSLPTYQEYLRDNKS
jgi:hypothetical protein